MSQHRLPFWEFFVEIEQRFSYERWIDKYKIFLKMIVEGKIKYDEDWYSIRRFCKALYLQDIRDELKFDELLKKAIAREQIVLFELLQKGSTKSKDDQPSKKPRKSIQKKDESETESNDREEIAPPGEKEEEEIRSNGQDRRKLMYYDLPVVDTAFDGKLDSISDRSVNFLYTDEYFPVTRRQMIKGWQFLRHKEKGGGMEGIDLLATIKQISKDGMFLELIFKSGTRNREDTLIIFADFRGSMTPFHELTNRLIHTARNEGGHSRAPIYYFKNYPAGFVYRQPNLTDPIKVKEALSKCNRNFTLAIIISDAGAARGGTESERRNGRAEMTGFFLDQLKVSCAHTIWLNPMPTHRWKGTAAEDINKMVFLMAPILDSDTYNFQDTLRTILKQNIKATKTNP